MNLRLCCSTQTTRSPIHIGSRARFRTTPLQKPICEGYIFKKVTHYSLISFLDAKLLIFVTAKDAINDATSNTGASTFNALSCCESM